MAQDPVFITVGLGIPINDTGQFLLSQRFNPEIEEVHLKWQIAGGGVEFGESPEQTVSRELQEELGIATRILYPQPIVKTSIWMAKKNGHQRDTHATLMCYIVSVVGSTSTIQLDTETHDCRWFELEEITELDMMPQSHQILLEADSIIKQHHLLSLL